MKLNPVAGEYERLLNLPALGRNYHRNCATVLVTLP